MIIREGLELKNSVTGQQAARLDSLVVDLRNMDQIINYLRSERNVHRNIEVFLPVYAFLNVSVAVVKVPLITGKTLL